MWWIVLTVVAVVLLYWRLIRPHKYWVNMGVKQGKPAFIFGEMWGAILQKEPFATISEEFYHRAPNTRYFGLYQFLTPTLLLKDPDLIKQMTVKDFDHFVDHSTFVPDDIDPLWSNNLFALSGKKWREMRSTLSPAFTSSKMKFMFSLISQSGEQFINYFLNKKEDIIIVEMKDTFTRFTNDVIANTAFGIQCDSLKDRNNDFYLMGKEATNLTGFWNSMKFTAYFLVPSVCKFFKLTLFSKRVADFFNTIIKKNIESRQKHGIVRPDLIHLLVEARKNGFKQEDPQPIKDTGFATVEESEIGTNPKTQRREITDEDITAQALLFFFAGFDSVSSLMSFMSYELAVNPNIQERLIQEVDNTLEACKGKLTYEAVLGMKYMDMVVSESLRKWPVNIVLDRICTKPYTIQPKNPDEKPVYLKEKDFVWLPVYALHRDPQYYPEPERFDPERFSDENKDKINPYAFIPFSVGPRNCIGSRFALLETKTLFFYVLANFQIVPVKKTQIPLKLSKKSFNLLAEDGFWLGLKRRSKV